ncbi:MULTISPECIES: mycothiol system anti-sigma-R factor [Brachybacterium]|uniref:Mycothiol system anti-sigma-R factor n=1 Tax=Brachybacterium alimentarium TaxID=47845 RepID=A0A2A3YIF2_9MICO|nr:MULTISPECIES: mycothiol system anti-sigma-R factor [Brachybacterium]PCC32862.1 mycothiol system anti-sigma-R factor [Brachybacterium alimentarium]PCC38875.1 mycothiol system anti-sigma-R factor [Brachybacterium alimentarium]RCS64276.1 mycothiol system anti-sigma-R factor [Brachybacterium sp. JB7]RCS68544.1 mycothiol system anti-sigma-R factor [Brachybacterium alimentarium]RCS77616.1 mycothiol system anti-sigma-R factor [Brachybacterium alimentarium]
MNQDDMRARRDTDAADSAPRDARYRLEEALDGELPRETVERMERHTEDCPECAEEWERVRRIKELVRRSCADRAPSSLRERITVECQSVSVTRTTEVDGTTSVHISATSSRRELPGA